MYNIRFIHNVIKKYIEKKITKFIIYPFGEDGLRVKNVLANYFNIEPCYIVDNEYCKYSDKIISGTILREKFSQDMYIVIATANFWTNKNIIEELSEYVPSSNIISFEQILNEMRAGFQVDSFLPSVNIIGAKTNLTGKIKVRFLHNASNSWNVISSICEAFRIDSLFEVLIIIGNDDAVVKQVQDRGFNYILLDDYFIENDQPDILVIKNSFDTWSELYQCRKIAKLIVVTSMELVRYQNTLKEFWEQQEIGYGRFQPDYYLYDSLLYNEIKNSEYFSDKLIHMGNAKFDGIYDSIKKKQYIGKWQKLKGKRTVLWATTHGVSQTKVINWVTFDRYAKVFFEYAANNKDMGFIFRPHSAFIDEMLELGFWSKNDLYRVREYCNNSPNIVFDDTDAYNAAFSIADGILTEAFCGIICSALPTLKPICVGFRTKSDTVCHNGLIDNYYKAYEEEDVIRFFERIKKDEDPMAESRKNASIQYVKNFDGKNGWRIKEFIKEAYLTRIS